MTTLNSFDSLSNTLQKAYCLAHVSTRTIGLPLVCHSATSGCGGHLGVNFGNLAPGDGCISVGDPSPPSKNFSKGQSLWRRHHPGHARAPAGVAGYNPGLLSALGAWSIDYNSLGNRTRRRTWPALTRTRLLRPGHRRPKSRLVWLLRSAASGPPGPGLGRTLKVHAAADQGVQMPPRSKPRMVLERPIAIMM